MAAMRGHARLSLRAQAVREVAPTLGFYVLL